MQVSNIQSYSNYNFCGLFKKGKREQPRHVTRRNREEEYKCQRRVERYSRRPDLQLPLMTTMDRTTDVDMAPGKGYFVDYDTKVRLGLFTTIDFNKPEMKSVLSSMDVGDTYTIGSDAGMCYECEPDVSSEHLKVVKVGENIFVISDVSDTHETTILKNIDNVNQFDVFFLDGGNRHLIKPDALIKLDPEMSFSISDYPSDYFDTFEEKPVYRSELRRSDKYVPKEDDDKKIALYAQKKGNYYLVRVTDEFRFPLSLGSIAEQKELNPLPENFSSLFATTVEDEQEEIICEPEVYDEYVVEVLTEVPREDITTSEGNSDETVFYMGMNYKSVPYICKLTYKGRDLQEFLMLGTGPAHNGVGFAARKFVGENISKMPDAIKANVPMVLPEGALESGLLSLNPNEIYPKLALPPSEIFNI